MSAPVNSTGKCPLCGKPASGHALPFCSIGCKDRDLLNWLDEAYRVPTHPALDDEAESMFESDEG
jgi:endogenous inhibitor of DNA gyrase (YacG/DUF329 family)